MRRTVVALLGALCLTGTACGSQLSRDQLLEGAAGRRTASITAPAASDLATATADPASAGGAADAPVALPEAGAVGSSAGESGAPVGGAVASAKQSAPGSTGSRSGATSPSPGSAAVAPTPGARDVARAPAKTGGEAAPTTPAPGGTATKSRVTIATVSTISGPVGVFFGKSIEAITIWSNWINRHGGVNGHPVRHLVINDGGDPGRFNAGVRQAAEQEGAISFVFLTMGFGGHGDMSYFEQHKIPVVSDEGANNLAYTSPMLFEPFTSGSPYALMTLRGFADVIVPEGKTKVAGITCSDVSMCDLWAAQWNAESAKAMGIEFVYTARPSLVQPDYTAECIGAKNAGAQAIIIGMDPASVARIAKACLRQGFNPTLAFPDSMSLPDLATAQGMEGAVVSTRVVPWLAKDNPAVAQMYSAFAEIAPGREMNGSYATGWAAAKLFEAAARKLPDNPTSADVLNGLYSLNGDDLGGFALYPLKFSPGVPTRPQVCYGSVRIQGGKYVALNGGKTRCDSTKTDWKF